MDVARKRGLLRSGNLTPMMKFTSDRPRCHGNENVKILAQNSRYSASVRHTAKNITHMRGLSLIKVVQFLCVTEIYPRSILVATATKIGEF